MSSGRGLRAALRPGPWWPLLAIVALGLALAVAAQRRQEAANREQAQRSLQAESDRVLQGLQQRLLMIEQGLRGARAVVIAAGGLDRMGADTFGAYQLALDAPAAFPGVSGVGIVRRVPAGPGGAARDIVQFMEPAQRNQGLVGLDLAQEPGWRDTPGPDGDGAQLTPPRPGAEAGGEGGLLMRLPLPAGEAGGWVVAGISSRALIGGLVSAGPELGWRLVDNDGSDYRAFVASGGSFLDCHARTSHATLLHGRGWTLELCAGPAYVRALALPSPLRVLVAGAGLTLAATVLAALALLSVERRRGRRRELLARHAELEARVAERTAALDHARGDLQAVIDGIPSLVSYFDRDLVCRFANRAHREWLGIDPATLPGQPLAALVDPATLALIGPALQSALAGHGQILYRDFPHADGRPRRVASHYEPAFDGTSVRGAYILIHDIDDLHRSQQALALERERLRSILAGTGASTWEWDIAGDRLRIDDSLVALLGHRPDERLSPAAQRLALTHPDDRDEVQRRFAAHLRGDTPLYEAECRMQHADGRWLWVRDSGRVSERDAQGRALRMSGTVLDIDERKRAQQAMQDSERRFRLFADNVDEGIIVAADGRVIDVSEVWARIFRCSVADAIGRPALDFAAPETRDEVRRRIESGDAEPYEAVLLRADGTSFPARLRGRSLELAGRHVRLTTVLDISAQKQAEASLEQARAEAERASLAKSQFLANMSHEIRTPLNAVIGLAYLFQDTRLDEGQRQLVGKIQLAGRALLGLINDVLDLSKIEAGEMALDDAPIHLPGLLDDVRRLLAAQAEAKGLTLALQAAPDLPPRVRGDELRLRQILVNLVGNAVKFTESGGITVIADALPGAAAGRARLRLEVRDTGIGIAPEALPRLFTPFTQADASNARRFSGTGLGLSIVRQLAEMMGGRAGVASTLGAGSRFWVELELPLADDDGRAAMALTVLVAEDDADQRADLMAMARGLGWQVEAVADGPALVRRATERLHAGQPPDALLVDWQMPGLDGLSALAALAQAYGRARVPAAVVVSASEVQAVRAAPHAELADAVLTKPVGPSALFNAVNSAVVRQQGSHERLLRSTRMDPAGAQWLAGVRVLVVDDSEVNLDVARHILERQGAAVATAVDGRQALARVRAGGFDAVLMDVQMPVLDGNEATRELRRDPAFAMLPVIALTAGALLAERQRSLDAGMTDFLTKPLDPELLVRTLRRHVEAARGQPLPAVALAEAVAAPGPGWPAIQGVRVEEAKARLAGDRALFLRLLRRLLEEHGHLAEAPAGGWAAVTDGQPWAAALHKLRGAAGTVAAVAVHRLAGEAETAARTQAPGPALLRLMPALGQALRDLELHARPWLVQEDRAEAPSEPPPEGTALQTLRALLAQRDLAALSRADELDGALRAWLGSAGHARWRERLEALDFDGADAVLASNPAGAA